ncbi:carbohydrate ABC transporter permease [uncultured Ruthenibacterium sp.]|uniref:carbohydrate ABC transporter permease n=1 Tax=uncultured Ruthenibacterium sp. TaxID=1905347 RepID=UPI002597552E|nr:carbohydrate ABC transporter permease [uncultured Ruthenibacterium sp.]
MQKRYHTLENIIFDAIVYLVMAFVLICCLVPFIYMLAVSFSGTKPLINGEVFLWPKDFTLDSYKQIFTYPNFFKAYGNTFLYAVGGTAIALIMTSLMAYPLSKTFLWGNKFFTKMVVVTMFFSGGLIPNYLLLNSLHLVGTRAAKLMPFAINSFNLIILINFFRSIPNEIEEAALIDGLGYFGILRRIVLPLSTAAIATIGLYYAVFFWNDWFNSLIYLKSDQYPVMMFLRNIVNGTMVIGTGSGSAEKTTIAISVKSAVIITSTVPIIVIYPFLQKFFVKGLTIGGVKG